MDLINVTTTPNFTRTKLYLKGVILYPHFLMPFLSRGVVPYPWEVWGIDFSQFKDSIWTTWRESVIPP